MSAHTSMHDKLREWLGHNRECDNWNGVENERCRLNHDQAMRLCFELAQEPHIGAQRRELALLAYRAARPWDLIGTQRVYPTVVPL